MRSQQLYFATPDTVIDADLLDIGEVMTHTIDFLDMESFE